MATPLLPSRCFDCTGWHSKTGGMFGYCPSGKKTSRDHECDQPIPDGLPTLENFERRRWAANANPEPTVFTCYGR